MNNWITITGNTFSKGKYFKVKQQFCYIDRLMMLTDCPSCQECFRNQIVMHYRVEIDGEFYYIPEFNAVETDCVFNPIDADIHARINWEQNQQPKDFNQAYRDFFGRDIDNTYVADHNVPKEIAKVNFKTYGNADPSKGPQPLPRPSIESCPDCKEKDIIYPVIQISLEDMPTIYRGDTIQLVPVIVGLEDRLTFLWSTQDTERDIMVSPTEDTTYTIVATDDLGCTYNTKTMIRVINYLELSQPEIDLDPTPLSTPSTIKTITIKGTAYQSTDIIISMPVDNFEFSLDGINWYTSITIPYTGSPTPPTTIYIHCLSDTAGAKSENMNLAVDGQVYQVLINGVVICSVIGIIEYVDIINGEIIL
jgi:hypothetical protein